MNIFMIGYRSTGKSTVGKRLADRLGLTFVDADWELAEQAGEEIREVVRTKGWPFFRELEKNVMGRICRRREILCATGGGVVGDDENIRMMQESGLLVWLRADVNTIRNRMKKDGGTDLSRPGLTDRGAFDEIESVLLDRTPLYENAADLAIDTGGISVDAVVSGIIHKMEKR